MHFVDITIPIVTGAYGVAKGYMNPTNELPGVCYLQDLPAGCSKTDSMECIRGEDYDAFSMLVGGGIIFGSFLLTAVSMVLLVLSVRATEKKMQAYGMGTNAAAELKLTKQTGIRALMIIGAFVATFLMLIILLFFDPGDEENGDGDGSDNPAYFFVLTMNELMMPAQGAFLAMIFIGYRWKELSSPGRSLHFLQPVVSLLTKYCCCCFTSCKKSENEQGQKGGKAATKAAKRFTINVKPVPPQGSSPTQTTPVPERRFGRCAAMPNVTKQTTTVPEGDGETTQPNNNNNDDDNSNKVSITTTTENMSSSERNDIESAGGVVTSSETMSDSK